MRPPPTPVRSVARCRLIFVTNHLPLKVTKEEGGGWSFEWDADALVLQAKEGLEEMDAVYVGCLPVEIEGHEQEVGRLMPSQRARMAQEQRVWHSNRHADFERYGRLAISPTHC